MASPSIASYFNVRKRAATDDIVNARNKQSRLDSDTADPIGRAQTLVNRAISAKNKLVDADTFGSSTKIAETVAPGREKRTVRRGTKRTATSTQPSAAANAAAAAATTTTTANKETLKQPKIVKFTLGGSLSPRKNSPAKAAFQSIERNATPTKQPKIGGDTDAGNNAKPSSSSSDAIKASILSKNVAAAKKELTFDEIKEKIGRSSRLDDLKAILNKRQQLEERYQACVNKRMAKQKANNSPAKLDGQSLKAFDTIELEVLSSPQKGLRTPTKTPIKTPIKEPGSAEKCTTAAAHNDLMSPKRAATPRRLFSPTKSAAASIPAYQRFQNLASDAVTTTLQLPYKYRSLLETFRCVDSICAMFYNRKETITFKKLKPAVQRMMRKNLTEKHLAQLKYLDPDAYHFEQRKMLNPGSHTKYDYYQLVIIPNVQPVPETAAATAAADVNDEIGVRKLDDDNLVRNADTKTMNPHIMIARLQRFQQILLDRVKHEHDLFLRNLNPPIIIPKDKIRRWHQDFDLEACPEILPGELPQPPNIEKFSSAKDILSTARNLFNCATPTERIMERYEASTQNAANKLAERQMTATSASASIGTPAGTSTAPAIDPPSTPLSSAPPPAEDPVAKVLKGVPKALLEKIRAKQAAKQLDAMTRRPSQDAEASKYARLPELARYIRNIFVTENKGVLELDKVMAKLENSFREKMSREHLRELLELMAKEAPRNWLTFHFIRKTDFIKINRHENLAEIINELERKAHEKAE